MKQITILMVEDEEKIRNINRDYLESLGYEVICAGTIAKAREFLHIKTPDLILLDIMLPDGTGLDYLNELRQSTSIPIILLTAIDENESIVTGLEKGADDYITKPYDLSVLSARIAASLRRCGIEFAGRICQPPLYIDLLSGSVSINDRHYFLPPKELQLLCCLALSIGKRIQGEELYRRTWGEIVGDYKNTLSVNISRLRKHLELDLNSEFEIVANKQYEYMLRKTKFY